MNKVTKTLLINLFGNLFLSIIKILTGIISNYTSLITDGLNSLSDFIIDIVSIFGNKLSLKPADAKHPLGHGKIEYITSTIIGLIIITLGINIIINSLDNKVIIPNLFIVYVSILSIIIKYILSNYIYKNGLKYQNNILIASAKEGKTDVISSLLVIISVIFIKYSNKIELFKYADIICTILISLLIIKTGYMILIDNLSKILGEQINDENYINKIKEIILKDENILEIKSIYVLKNGPYYKLLSNIIMESTLPLFIANKKINKIEKEIKKFDNKIKYVFIHTEPKIIDN